MERRRVTQIAFNRKHGITPKGVSKAVTDVMEGAYRIPAAGGARARKVAEQQAQYQFCSPEQILSKINKLEEQMYHHARDLEFEQAARLRDEIEILQGVELGVGARKAG